VISLRRYRYALVLVLTVLSAPPHASAVTMTLDGPGSVAPAGELTSTIWAGVPDGRPAKIAALGAEAPGGGTFTDMGVPSISPDNQVVFGAEVTDPQGVARWDIFRANLNAPTERRLARVMENSPGLLGCVPNMKVDPYPLAGSNDVIAFIAPEAAGRDALFRYSAGELTCAVRVGDRTAQGHVLKLMHFGSATMAPSGEVAFLGDIDDVDSRRNPGANHGSHVAMILAAPHEAISEIAAEGSRDPGGARYLGRFGLPAAVSTPHGAMVAFTAMTVRGSGARRYGLYVFRGGKTVEVLASGERSKVGRITFLSDGRPALSGSGNIATRAASANRGAIFAIRGGDPFLVVAQGHATEDGSRIVSFGDPVVSASGRIIFGVSDDEDRSLLYAVNPWNVMRISVPAVPDGELVGGLAVPVFSGTLVTNQAGAFAFLGAK
jgi:hypothetical protein